MSMRSLLRVAGLRARWLAPVVLAACEVATAVPEGDNAQAARRASAPPSQQGPNSLAPSVVPPAADGAVDMTMPDAAPAAPGPDAASRPAAKRVVRAKEVLVARVTADVIYAEKVEAQGGRIAEIHQHPEEKRWEKEANEQKFEAPALETDVLYAKDVKVGWVEARVVYVKDLKVERLER